MADRWVWWWEDVIAYVASEVLHYDLPSYSTLEGADDTYDLTCRDGAMVSLCDLPGLNTLVGSSEYEEIIGGLTQTLQPFLSRPGHMMQFSYTRNPEVFPRELESRLHPYRAAAQRLGLRLDEFFDERTRRLSQYCASEWGQVAMWSFPTLLSRGETKAARGERARAQQPGEGGKKGFPRRGLDPLAASGALRLRHRSFVDAVLRDMGALDRSKTIGFIVHPLEVRRAANYIRMLFADHLTADDWAPHLPPAAPPLRETARHGDVSGGWWPKLREQIFGINAEEHGRLVKVGGRYYSTLVMEMAPQAREPFDLLLGRALGSAEMPWRATINVRGGGMTELSARFIAATAFGFFKHNRLINQAKRALEEMALAGEAMCSVQASFTTWANTPAEAEERSATLMRAVQGWGDTDVREICGDEIEALVTSVPGAAPTQAGNRGVLQLGEALRLVPMRPSSYWQTGFLCFRSPDGKFMPIQPGSALQAASVELVMASQGQGKSVLLNAKNMAFLLNPKAEGLPRITNIDVGPSSEGLVLMIKEALSLEHRHLAVRVKVENRKGWRINPFDLPLGFRRPLPRDRAMLIAIVTSLLTPAGQQKPPEEGVELASLLVDEAYRRVEGADAPLYMRGLEPAIDAIADAGELRRDEHTTWAEIVEELFKAGRTREATLAQRHAVPTMPLLAAVATSQKVLDEYGAPRAAGQESLASAATRMLSAALRDFPILDGPTTFDLGEARIVVLDLDDVAREPGPSGEKTAAICYMLAMFTGTRNFYLREGALGDEALCPRLYWDYHARNIKEVTRTPSHLCMDEYHRARKVPAMNALIEVEAREARKWGVHLTLVSQSVTDFPEVITSELFTGLYILNAPSEVALQEYVRRFGLTETQQTALQRYCTGPREEGSTCFAIHRTKRGSSAQLLTLTLGARELWAYSTTHQDAAIRNALYQEVGPERARALLAQAFPQGSAAKEIERREARLRESRGVVDQQDVLGGIIADLVSGRLRNYA